MRYPLFLLTRKLRVVTDMLILLKFTVRIEIFNRNISSRPISCLVNKHLVAVFFFGFMTGHAFIFILNFFHCQDSVSCFANVLVQKYEKRSLLRMLTVAWCKTAENICTAKTELLMMVPLSFALKISY